VRRLKLKLSCRAIARRATAEAQTGDGGSPNGRRRKPLEFRLVRPRSATTRVPATTAVLRHVGRTGNRVRRRRTHRSGHRRSSGLVMRRLVIAATGSDVMIGGRRRDVGRLRRPHILSFIPILPAVLLERGVGLLLARIPIRVGLVQARRVVV